MEEKLQRTLLHRQDSLQLSSTFSDYLTFHIIKRSQNFHHLIFKSNLNSLYQNLYDIEYDFELFVLIEDMYLKSKKMFFSRL